MNVIGLSPEKEAALERLLDDENILVREAVIKELERYGDAGAAFLKRVANGQNRILATHAKVLLQEMGGDDTVEGFSNFIQSFNYELQSGCLMLDRTVYPKLDVTEMCLFLDKIGTRCREIMVLPGSPIEKCKVINRVLFHEYGFRGDVDNFYNPENSFLSRVIDRRRGIPISLSILYILVAQRCNLQLEPIGVPGRFMVGCFEGLEPFYIDAFERGCFRTMDDVRNLVYANYGEDANAFLQPSTVGEVLCRCCRNLVNQYAAENNESKVRLFSKFVDEFESTYRQQEQS